MMSSSSPFHVGFGSALRNAPTDLKSANSTKTEPYPKFRLEVDRSTVVRHNTGMCLERCHRWPKSIRQQCQTFPEGVYMWKRSVHAPVSDKWIQMQLERRMAFAGCSDGLRNGNDETRTLNSFVPSTLLILTAFVFPYWLKNSSIFFCKPGSSFPNPFCQRIAADICHIC